MEDNRCASECALYNYCQTYELYPGSEAAGLHSAALAEIEKVSRGLEAQDLDQASCAVAIALEGNLELRRAALEILSNLEVQSDRPSDFTSLIKQQQALAQAEHLLAEEKLGRTSAFLKVVSNKGCPGPASERSGLLALKKTVACRAPVVEPLKQAIAHYVDATTA